MLPIQGPPGSGKTYTAANIICALVTTGKKVGVTANSHSVIRKLLDDVASVAKEKQLAGGQMRPPQQNVIEQRFGLGVRKQQRGS